MVARTNGTALILRCRSPTNLRGKIDNQKTDQVYPEYYFLINI